MKYIVINTINSSVIPQKERIYKALEAGHSMTKVEVLLAMGYTINGEYAIYPKANSMERERRYNIDDLKVLTITDSGIID